MRLAIVHDGSESALGELSSLLETLVMLHVDEHPRVLYGEFDTREVENVAAPLDVVFAMMRAPGIISVRLERQSMDS